MAAPHRAGRSQAALARRLVLAALALAAAATAAATTQFALAAKAPRPAALTDGKYFLAVCSATHRNNDDPIALPGLPGKSHNHTYVGNRSTNAFSTPESLLASAPSTSCQPTADASAYWFPTLYTHNRVALPLVTIVYYVRRTAAVEPIPAGLRMIAGNARAKRPQSADVAAWTCGAPVPGAHRYPYVPKCSVTRGLNLLVTFPDCWDGRRLDSPDHKRHMAYSSKRRCPATHPIALPAVKVLAVYPAVRGPRLASGRFSAHADFMNGWDETFLSDRVRGLNH